MGGRGSGGFNKKSIEQHIFEGTYRKDRHLKDFLRFKDEFKNDKDELINILNDMLKLNDKINEVNKRIDNKIVLTKEHKKEKKELEDKFILKWENFNSKYGRKNNIDFMEINDYIYNSSGSYLTYDRMFCNLWWYTFKGIKYDDINKSN